jgi:hypothetical protein
VSWLDGELAWPWGKERKLLYGITVVWALPTLAAGGGTSSASRTLPDCDPLLSDEDRLADAEGGGDFPRNRLRSPLAALRGDALPDGAALSASPAAEPCELVFSFALETADFTDAVAPVNGDRTLNLRIIKILVVETLKHGARMDKVLG